MLRKYDRVRVVRWDNGRTRARKRQYLATVRNITQEPPPPLGKGREIAVIQRDFDSTVLVVCASALRRVRRAKPQDPGRTA